MTYHFVRTFKKHYQHLKTYINFKIVPHTFSCFFCKPSDCIQEGKYCSINYEMGTTLTGKDVVTQQLR
jgi:hypothetical protein